MKVSREKWSKQFSEWYDWVLREGEIYDYGRYPVKGMGVWMPYGFRIRENIVTIVRRLLNSTGHEEVLFPLLIPEDLLRRESQHIKGFEEEVFWVALGGGEKLDVKLALRPTSEVAITYMENFWVKSYRDLPKKYYQIVSIFRYETKATRPLFRLREVTTFKEAHTVHSTYEDAARQVEEAVSIYSQLFDTLGIPYLISKRPEWDKFAGAEYTIAFDTIMPDGRVLQIGTAHHLGQHFTKALDVKIQLKDGSLDYPHQTSYGISDRVVAVAVSQNGDDHGPVLTPLIAPIKVVVIPIPSTKSEEDTVKVNEYARKVYSHLKESNLEVVIDDDPEKTPGEKYYIWELKGVPLRVEIGPREVTNNSVYLKRRDTFEGRSVKFEDVTDEVKSTLDRIGKELAERARERFSQMIVRVKSLEEASKILSEKGGIVEIPWCGKESCGHKMEEGGNWRVLGEPLKKNKTEERCAVCREESVTTLRIAKTY